MSSEIKPEVVKSASITVTYDTNISCGSNNFSSLQELKIWLDKHPLIAETLGYTKKK